MAGGCIDSRLSIITSSHTTPTPTRMPHNMNHNTHTYLTLAFSPSSPFFSSPASLRSKHPGLTYEGHVGELADVHLYSIPKGEWMQKRDGVLRELEGTEGVMHVEEQVLKQRVRREGDEL